LPLETYTAILVRVNLVVVATYDKIVKGINEAT